MVLSLCITQVPLGVILKSKMNYHDMLEIMQSLHKYVPCGIVQGDCDDKTAISTEQVATTSMHYLFGGDQVTVSRVRGCHGIQKNSITPQGTLQGLQPVVEDWHAKMCLLTVMYMYILSYLLHYVNCICSLHSPLQCIWLRLYSSSSLTEGGTLYQLHTLINRRNITADPSKNVDACEDFIETVLHAYILSAAMESFEMASIDDTLQGSTLFPEGLVYMSIDRRQKVIL